MIDKALQIKLEAKEKQLQKVCEELYLLNLKGKRIKPLPPKVIVRVLPKEHKTERGLYLPGNVQNKPMYEGIVLETWEPYDEYKTKSVAMNEYMSPPCSETTLIHHAPSVKVGDHILFPHFEGQPLSDYFDEKYYRIIPDSCIFGTIDYKGEFARIQEVKKLMESLSSVTTSGAKSGPGVPDWQPPAASSFFTS